MAIAAERPRELSLTLPVLASMVLHGALVAAFIAVRGAPPPPMPPIYHVKMIAAPPGPRAIGVVQPQPLAPTPATAPPPTRPKTEVAPVPTPTARKRPTKTVKQATPTPPTETRPKTKEPAPTAGGGETGGRGADVANVNTGGIDFPYPGYLENIVRQVALRFHPSVRGALRAEVQFVIRRDGSVIGIGIVKRSGVYSFDLEAQGAVEAAANANAFGPLPSGFADDALPVTFRFDPKVLR